MDKVALKSAVAAWVVALSHPAIAQDNPVQPAANQPQAQQTASEPTLDTTVAAPPGDATGAPSLGMAQPSAETPADVPGSDIVVTGSRLRNEAVQETPLAVSVVGPAALEVRQATNIESLSSLIPNVQIQDIKVGPGLPAISLRGFNTRTSDPAVEPGIPVYIDGIYQSIINGTLVDTYDIEKIEVLRGPQGTLLGKNASAGAILVSRTRPTGKFGLRGSLGYGTKNEVVARALLNFPLIDGVLAGKLFGAVRRRDGYIKNLATGQTHGGEEEEQIRAALMFTPSDNFELYVTADRGWMDYDQHLGRNISQPTDALCQGVPFFPGATTADIDVVCGRTHRNLRNVTSGQWTKGIGFKQTNATANLNWSLGGVKLTGITGWRRYKEVTNLDLDESQLPLLEARDQRIDHRQHSAELRLSSVENGGLDLDGRLAWLVAGYYAHSKGVGDLPLMVFGTISNNIQVITRDTYAVFGHVDFNITDAWAISAGARRSKDKVEQRYSLRQPGAAAPPLAFQHDISFKNSSFEAGTQYKLSRDLMAYYRYAEGYRGGGFIGLPDTPAFALSFRPETAVSHEVGIKSQWLDRKVMINVIAFTTKFQDLQRISAVQGSQPGSFIQLLINAGSAKTSGVELETSFRPTRNTTLGFNAGYLDAKYTEYAFGGRDVSFLKLSYAPKWTVSGSVDQTFQLGDGIFGFTELLVHANADWRAKFQQSEFNYPEGLQKAYLTADASLTFKHNQGLTLTGYVKNLTDKNFCNLCTEVGSTGGPGTPAAIRHSFDNFGRSFGVELGFKF